MVIGNIPYVHSQFNAFLFRVYPLGILRKRVHVSETISITSIFSQNFLFESSFNLLVQVNYFVYFHL